MHEITFSADDKPKLLSQVNDVLFDSYFLSFWKFHYVER